MVSSPTPETSLLARSCNKAEREQYFVFNEFGMTLNATFRDAETLLLARLGELTLAMLSAEVRHLPRTGNKKRKAARVVRAR